MKCTCSLLSRAGTALEILGLGSSPVFVFGLSYCLGSDDFLFRPLGPRHYSGFEWAQHEVELIKPSRASKKLTGFWPNQAQASSSPSFICCGPWTGPGLTGSGLGPFRLYCEVVVSHFYLFLSKHSLIEPYPFYRSARGDETQGADLPGPLLLGPARRNSCSCLQRAEQPSTSFQVHMILNPLWLR